MKKTHPFEGQMTATCVHPAALPKICRTQRHSRTLLCREVILLRSGSNFDTIRGDFSTRTRLISPGNPSVQKSRWDEALSSSEEVCFVKKKNSFLEMKHEELILLYKDFCPHSWRERRLSLLPVGFTPVWAPALPPLCLTTTHVTDRSRLSGLVEPTRQLFFSSLHAQFGGEAGPGNLFKPLLLNHNTETRRASSLRGKNSQLSRTGPGSAPNVLAPLFQVCVCSHCLSSTEVNWIRSVNVQTD